MKLKDLNSVIDGYYKKRIFIVMDIIRNEFLL